MAPAENTPHIVVAQPTVTGKDGRQYDRNADGTPGMLACLCGWCTFETGCRCQPSPHC